jgi:cytochrome c peroxidase
MARIHERPADLLIRRFRMASPANDCRSRRDRHQRSRRTLRTVFLSAFAMLAVESRVRGTNHDVHLDEVMAGVNGNSKIQFIVVEQEAVGQNAWGPQFGETHSRAMLVFFDATGRETGTFRFPANPPTGGTLKTLLATQEFASLPGAPRPDVIIPPLLSPISGKVCFKSNPRNEIFVRNECLSYGGAGFTGLTESSELGVPFGPPAAPLPIMNTVSLKRAADTGRNADFSLNTTPTPRNIAGGTFTIPVATPVAQGMNLFDNETFLGNGRTCASCHVASESFRLPPANIQGRFATLSSTFDPQFVGENAPSSFDAGFDFNLNMLALDNAVATGAPCTGELRGVITGTTGRAKVLTRVSPTQYLVYGGRSPVLSGTVTDGVCAATMSTVTPGTLSAVPGSGSSGLEDPSRMRRSGSPDFSQGRGLILENIDGFPPTDAVFRKSPHLLNLSRTAPFGFSGDIPDLRTFATGAVQQHFPRTLARRSSGANPDFRLPTADELAALETFMLAQEVPSGTDPDKFNLDRFATTAAQIRGRTAFFGPAKCSECHGGPVLATTTVNILGKGIGVNAAFNTGVVNQSINSPAGDNLPAEQGGAREFSVPQLFNVGNLGPYFHDASAATLRQAVEFYTSTTFNTSPAGVAIGGIVMSPQDIDDIIAFLEGLDASPVVAVNDPPTIAPIQNHTTLEDVPLSAIPVTIGDLETAPASLTLSGRSSNALLVPDSNITFGGAGASRTVTVVPAPNQFGAASIVVTVSDGLASTSTSFQLTVVAVNDAPTITAIANQTINKDTATMALPVTVGDVETAPAGLTVSGSSSNQTLVPNANVVVGGSGAIRTVTVTPAPGRSGTATITVTVSDGSLMNSTAFLLVVNDPPLIATQPESQTVTAGQAARFTVVASGSPAPALQWQSSANTGTSWVDLTNGAPFSGVTTSVLTVTGAPLTLSGVQFRVVARNEAGSTTSAAAALTVQAGESRRFVTDADGDGRNDLAVFRPAVGVWFIRYSSRNFSTSSADAFQWGLPGDVPLSADFDGDGRIELSVFRPATGQWFIRFSSRAFDASGPGVFQWGLPGDVPLTGDFDGDGRSEIAVFRPSTGGWFIRKSSEDYAVATASFFQWGLPGDVPIAADFDGDGRTELTVFRPATGQWFIRYSSLDYDVGKPGVYQWGLPGDVPLSGDFDRDGRSELAVFRPAIGGWFIRYSSRDFSVAASSFFQWGLAGDVPIVGDFDGDGKTELTVFRGPTGQWFIRYSSQDYDVNTHDVFQWGLPGDVPIKP